MKLSDMVKERISLYPSSGEINSKIENPKEQKRLKQLIRSIKPAGFGVIIRTIALGKKVAELDKDLKNLYKKWQSITKKLKDAKYH